MSCIDRALYDVVEWAQCITAAAGRSPPSPLLWVLVLIPTRVGSIHDGGVSP